MPLLAPLSSSRLVFRPLPVPFPARSSQGCAGVDWTAVNTTSCTMALDDMDVSCPPECTAVLDKLSPECKATLQANGTAGASEEEIIAQMLSEACGVVAAPAPAPAAAA